MKKVGILLCVCLFAACQQVDKTKTITVIDPNNTSEMALLMREMFSELEGIKEKIQKGEDISSEQLDFELIHNQTPTDEGFLKEGIKSRSNAYAYSVNFFNEEPNSKNFSSIVNNCMSCHTMMCPGPLERIDNLILE
tara:strand:+ start:180 stop:590 length:411 start_codon:yes stop_codon:yes gene_type:complete